MANSMDPIRAVCSGSTLFASILNSSVMLGNYLQQTTSADDIFGSIFFLALFKRANIVLAYSKTSNFSKYLQIRNKGTRFIWKQADLDDMNLQVKAFSDSFTSEYTADTEINTLWSSFKMCRSRGGDRGVWTPSPEKSHKYRVS